MPRKILLALATALFSLPVGLLAIGQAPPATQVRIPTDSLPASPDIDQAAVQKLLQEGYAHERQKQWADALLHYEEAARAYPGQTDLLGRLQVVRIHFDLSRRYADDSFVQSTRSLSSADALDLFSEVCVKIQSHYVETPDWQSLIRRGNQHLEIALRAKEFIQTNNIEAADKTIDGYVRYLFQAIRQRSLSDRRAVQSFVYSMAQVGQSQLGLSPVSTIMEYVCGATGSLDEYSTFLTPGQLDDVYSQIEGNFVGLGIELKASRGALQITNVIRGGPADRSEIRVGDRIVAVDGQSMQDISTEKAAGLLKGDQGSFVEVTVVNASGIARRLRMRRERVDVPSVEDAHIIDPQAGIAYLKLTSFQKTTSRDFDTALWELLRQRMRSLIVDVRGNPGGLLTESVEVADKFIVDGIIVSTRGRSPREDFDYKATRDGTWRVSLVVLIDHESASASEIFAGAIRDHRRGTIVGHRSYGKGSVQGIFPLRIANSGLRLTTARFYSPNGHPISLQGVEPDVVVRHDERQASGNHDPVLKAGIEVARQLIVQR